MLASRLTAALLTVFACAGAQAATVVSTLPDYDGPLNSGEFPVDLGVIGTFNFALPVGAVITGAAFSGTYGTAVFSPSTAGYDVVIEGEQFTICTPLAPAVLPGLLDGSADLQLIQTNRINVRLGSPTLTVEYDIAAVVPVPGSFALMGLGLAGLIASARRRRSA